jgi:hypothetical protein
VLEEMRNAPDSILFKSAAGLVPYLHRHDRRAALFERDYLQPIAEDFFSNAIKKHAIVDSITYRMSE